MYNQNIPREQVQYYQQTNQQTYPDSRGVQITEANSPINRINQFQQSKQYTQPPPNTYIQPQFIQTPNPQYMAQNNYQIQNQFVQSNQNVMNQVKIQQSSTYIPHTHEYKVPQQVQVQTAREIQPTKQIVNTKQPEINEIYHVERDLQVLSVEEVEEPWKRKCVQLEIFIYDLQTELARYKNMVTDTKITTVDDSQIKELEAKIQFMKDVENGLRNDLSSQQNEIDQWRTRYQKLQLEFQQKLSGGDELRQLREIISEKERIILKLEGNLNHSNTEIQSLIKEIQQRDQEINYLRNQIKTMEDKMESFMQSEEQVTYLTNEVDVWKQKFKHANQEFHNAQEKWMMAQAELDSLKNKQTIVTTEKQTIQSWLGINIIIQMNNFDDKYFKGESFFFNPLQNRVKTFQAFRKCKYPNIHQQSISKSYDYLRKNQIPPKRSFKLQTKGFVIPKEINVSELWSQKQYLIVQNQAKLNEVNTYCKFVRSQNKLLKLQEIQQELKDDPLSMTIDEAFQGRKHNLTQMSDQSKIKYEKYPSLMNFEDQSTNFEVSRIRSRVCSLKDMQELKAKFVNLLNQSKQRNQKW